MGMREVYTLLSGLFGAVLLFGLFLAGPAGVRYLVLAAGVLLSIGLYLAAEATVNPKSLDGLDAVLRARIVCKLGYLMFLVAVLTFLWKAPSGGL